MSTPGEQTLELELTYLAARLPEEVLEAKPKRLTDFYVPGDLAIHPRLRIRQKGDRYELTKKLPAAGDDASQHHEQTLPLTAEEFDTLSQATSRAVSKDRYEVTINGRAAEVDVFRGELKGLVLIDFEFASHEEMNSFTRPDVCGADVTQEDFIAGGLLAGRTYADISGDLDRLGYKRISS